VSELALELEGLCAGYGGRDIVNDLSLEVPAGEFLAVLGPNGSGKTTLLKVLLGLLKPRQGTVTLWGEPPKVANRRIGYVPQHRDFDPDLPIRGRELVELGVTGQRFGIPWTSRALRRQVDAAIREVGAEGYADAPVGLLSGGEQQRLRIAQALLGEPNVLLCDEPLLALDPRRQHQIAALIDRHRREQEAAVLFVTHEINPILNYVDRVLYLVGGRWAVGLPDEILTTERLSDLYGLSVEVHHHHGQIMVVAGEEGTSQLMGHHHEHDNEDRSWA
jgi:zinc/manganese transport system ATP-binding protein